MSFIQRLSFFILGIVLGSVFVGYIMQQRRAAAGQNAEAEAVLAPVGAEAIQRAAVPGIMRAYNQRQVPMQSEYIKSEHVVVGKPQAGLAERYLVLRGMESEQLLAIYEVTEEDADKVWGQLEQVRIMAADRAQVRVQSGVSREALAAALAPLQMQIIRGLDSSNTADPSAPVEVTLAEGVRYETPADVAVTDLYLVSFPMAEAGDIPAALAKLSVQDGVASASFDYLDAADPFVRRARK